MNQVIQQRTLSVLILMVLCLTQACSNRSSKEISANAIDANVNSADLVILNAKVYTVNTQQAWAEAIAVKNGIIEAVSTTDQIREHIGPQTHIIDAAGQVVLPGLHDSHVHPVWAGTQMGLCDLTDAPTIEAILEEIQNCAQNQTGEWVLGGGYNPTLFSNAAPHKDLLDDILPDRPIYLDDADGHGAWVNSKALELANITAQTKVDEGSVIELDPTTGEPMGTLREGAVNLVRAAAPPPSLDQRLAGMKKAQELANSLGITSMIAAQSTEMFLEAMYEYAKSDKLTVNILASLHYGGDVFETPTPELIANRHRYQTGRLTTHSAKIFADGVLEGGTAAMLEPYEGFGHSGSYLVPPEQLKIMVQTLDEQNIQAHIHAIGDAGIRASLDAYEYALEKNGARDNRHHISHLQVVNPADIDRFAKLNVTANFQALWAYPDEYITEFNLPELGQERVGQMYPLASILKSGGRIVGGSDWSVSSLNPFLAIETAVTREDATDQIKGVLNANERVSVEDMIAAYTINTAYLMKHEQTRGSIEVGKQADIIVIDQNIFEIPPKKIGDIQVLYTLLDGKIVYQR